LEVSTADSGKGRLHASSYSLEGIGEGIQLQRNGGMDGSGKVSFLLLAATPASFLETQLRPRL
jgi:hypothetical protein